jgi:quercetin dioxygenase-like cupin family protein
MRLFRFDAEIGRPIDQFGSARLMLAPIARITDQVQIGCMHIGPAGVVGFHQAGPAQLFLVVAGEGWVRSENPERVSIQAGQAAFWKSGEWHESGSHTGMTAIVIESETLDPGQYMPEKLPG